ncbi:MAG: glycosyltransferase family 2 protein [Candidatus Gottesmanbacteria bacterium]|nr:glycosyltransferase family 2 protein [Candidatus Gottesmanbacteria bacterium]
MISAIVLSHNDEDSIARTLVSLTWCDEIIVIDDFSTDATLHVAKKYTTNIYQHHLNDDFASQRNFALTKASGDWVLFIDSDEVVPTDLANEIQNSLEIDCAGFYIKRTDWLFGKPLRYGETGRVRLLRLAKKDAGTWKRTVHEVWNVDGMVAELSHPLDHFPHPDVAQFIEEINRYSTINAQYLYSKKVRVQWWHIIAYPKVKFFIDYFWYLGFLDGTAGAVVAIMMSFHSFLTRAKLYLLWHKHE